MVAVWNKNVVVGRKGPLSAEEVKLLKLSIKFTGNKRDELLLHFAIDTSLRGVDLVKLKVADICDTDLKVKEYFYVKQSKTSKNVMCNLSDESKKLVLAYINAHQLELGCYLFTSLYKVKDTEKHITAHHYRELIKKWLKNASLDQRRYTSHSLRRTRISYIYKQTGNLRACQMLLGHSSILNTALYLGVEEMEALEVAQRHYI